MQQRKSKVLSTDDELVQKLENRIRKSTYKNMKASYDTAEALDDSTDEEATFQSRFGSKT